MVFTENVATRVFLHSTTRLGITDHHATRMDEHACPLPYLLTSVTRFFFVFDDMAAQRVRATTTARERRPRRSGRPRHDCGPPPGRPRPDRSCPRAAGHSQAPSRIVPSSGRTRSASRQREGTEACAWVTSGAREARVNRARRGVAERRLMRRCAPIAAGQSAATRAVRVCGHMGVPSSSPTAAHISDRGVEE